MTAAGLCYLDARLALRRRGFDLDVALQAEAGEVLAILGPNGSGKTTTLLALAGLLPLDGGFVRVDGATWADAAAGRTREVSERHTGLVLADHLLFPHLTAVGNVAFGPRSRGASRAESTARALRELKALGVADLAARRPAEVSHGQAQRIALARALATDPALLLLDEPLAALDPATRAEVRGVLGRRLAAYRGVTLLVTHDPLDALTLADRLVFVDGRPGRTGRHAARGRHASAGPLCSAGGRPQCVCRRRSFRWGAARAWAGHREPGARVCRARLGGVCAAVGRALSRAARWFAA
jgi:molybdate transport system ATP-binding protein